MTDTNANDVLLDVRTAYELGCSLNSLIIHRDLLNGNVFSELLRLLEFISSGDMYSAERSYYALTAALIEADPRRVSGNLFSDYILSSIIETENVFSKMAARGFLDEYVYGAMTHDLKILLPLCDRFDEQLQLIIDKQDRPKPIQKKADDKISLMADAAWGGNTTRPIRPPVDEEGSKPVNSESFNFISWNYGGFDLRDTYVCDAALEEIYMRCLNPEPQGLTEDLWNFFNAYGTGIFLKARAFTVSCSGTDKKLVPMPESVMLPKDTDLCVKARAESLQNIIAFMRRETAMNTLISGGRGVGKTTLVLSALHELPEVRMIYITGDNARDKFRWALETAAAQPLKFIIAVDDIKNADELYAIGAELLGGMMQPDNTLIYCIVPESYDAPLFPNRITLELSLPELSELISAYFERAGRDIPIHEIQNACMDYQLETRLPLSYAALLPVIREIERENDL